MNIKDLKPASALALKLGVKSIAYGPPGSGKTPLVNTAPNPVLCVCEPGMLSMRNSNIPAFEAYSVAKIEEFFTWLFTSSERRKFDTVCIDSVSQLAELYLKDALDRVKHGKKAYGEMATAVMEKISALYFLEGINVYLIAKQMLVEVGENKEKRPYFPGQELNVRVPHLFDLILHIAPVIMPPYGTVTAIRTRSTFDILARDRSGLLSELEEPNLTKLFLKATGK